MLKNSRPLNPCFKNVTKADRFDHHEGCCFFLSAHIPQDLIYDSLLLIWWVCGPSMELRTDNSLKLSPHLDSVPNQTEVQFISRLGFYEELSLMPFISRCVTLWLQAKHYCKIHCSRQLHCLESRMKHNGLKSVFRSIYHLLNWKIHRASLLLRF